MADDPQPPKSILENLQQRTGLAPKVLLPDSDSEHGASPVVDPKAAATGLMPQGRGNYQIMGEIARGGMSVILKGHDTDLGRDVAVKVLEDELAKRPEIVQRFVEEAQIGGQLQHPGIVPVYELGLMGDDRPYFTMKLIKGRTLASLFVARKELTDNRGTLLGVFASVCQTVAYAHSKGVVHRDLKPANIMVGAFSEVQVVDWGLAKVLSRGGVADERRAQESSRASLHSVIETVRSGPGSVGSDSMVGSVMGTPAYMAPEQAQGEIEKLDERVDVFSLGAILCELLTGKPPYVDTEEERVIVQAARAHLDPARERIESSGADPALIRICLDCLTPARAARPANADEVAKAIQEYLSSTEERARQAQVEAAEARIKAAEERRARKLSLALGATITVGLLLAGGTYLWLEQSRAQREESVRIAVEEDHGEAIRLLQAGRADEALVSAERALALAQASEADGMLVERAERFVSQARSDVEAARDEARLEAEDEALARRLVDLRLRQIEAIGNSDVTRRLDADFRQAFLDYGADLEADDLTPALERFRDRGVEETVALALDDWSRLRRYLFGDSSQELENLFLLAMDLDDDPFRRSVREAIAARDRDAMIELSRPERLDELPASSIFVLSSALWVMFPQDRDVVYRAYDHALPFHPDDYVLQSVGGLIHELRGQYDAALACRTAALSQRPDDMKARLSVAEALLFLGRLRDCESAARACVRQDPESVDGHFILSMALLQLGRVEEALPPVERAYELDRDPGFLADILVNKHFLGLATREEVEEAAERTGEPGALGTLAFGLLTHPDPAERSPDLVLRRFDELKARLAAQEDWAWLVRTLAYAELGEWELAEEAMAGRYEGMTLNLVAPPVLGFVRAVVFANVGKLDVAREYFARGVAEADELMRGDEVAWKDSDVLRWREKARAAIGG